MVLASLVARMGDVVLAQYMARTSPVGLTVFLARAVCVGLATGVAHIHIRGSLRSHGLFGSLV